MVYAIGYVLLGFFFLGMKMSDSGLERDDWKPAILWPLVIVMVAGAVFHDWLWKPRRRTPPSKESRR